MRHSSPGFGTAAARAASVKLGRSHFGGVSELHGMAHSSDQPLSVSVGSFSVPSMWIAVFRPSQFHPCSAGPSSL
jgi:hypothetical protein